MLREKRGKGEKIVRLRREHNKIKESWKKSCENKDSWLVFVVRGRVEGNGR